MVPTGYALHEVAVSLDGRFAYVSDYGTGPQPGNTVTIIDLDAARLLAPSTSAGIRGPTDSRLHPTEVCG